MSIIHHEFRPGWRPLTAATIGAGCGITSSVGIAVNPGLEVVRADGEPVPNLYAAGELLGAGQTMGKAFVGGMMVTPAMSLGRWLGMTLPLGQA